MSRIRLGATPLRRFLLGLGLVPVSDALASEARWRAKVEQLRTRLECVAEGRRYPDCNGDCGENRMYCCDGAWDFYNRMAKAEADR